MATVQYKPTGSGKRRAVFTLFAASVLIMAAGLAFGVYSWVTHVIFTVFGAEIPGFVFAAFVVFLGVRYFKSVQKLSKKLAGTSQKFSWNNFKFKNSKTKNVEG